jgi:hypothetical protein
MPKKRQASRAKFSEPESFSNVTDNKSVILNANLLTFLSKAARWLHDIFRCQDPGSRKHERKDDMDEITTPIRTPNAFQQPSLL